MRVTKNEPSLEKFEIPMKVTAALPHGLFEKPMLTANIFIEEGSINVPPVDVSIIESLEQAAQDAFGVKLKVQI